MSRKTFGRLPDGRPVTAYRISTIDGPAVTVLDLGATVQSVRLPAQDGVEVVLGFDRVEPYLDPRAGYQGATVGRWANRLANASFSLDGTVHRLAANEGPTCLHGGPGGFHGRLWEVVDHTASSIRLSLDSEDGDQGFPGRLVAHATYRTEGRSVHLELEATCDSPTVVSLTNHSYFNLAGLGTGTVDAHELLVEADSYLPVDETFIPLGHLESVTGTPFDLREPARIGGRTRRSHPQVVRARGIDHAFHLRGGGMRRAARLVEPRSGRSLEVHTDQPSLQVYTGNQLDGTLSGPDGSLYRQSDGVALETQRHPDAPNQPSLGPSVLRPGELYGSRTEWRFDWPAG